MSRLHDMGGRLGDGAVNPAGDAVFAQEWHAQALAVTLAAGALGQWNIDSSRHARELLSPKDYTRFSYYEKWISALADLLVEHGIISEDELRVGRGMEISPLADKTLTVDRVEAVLSKGGPAERRGDISQVFEPGAQVKTRKPSRNILVEGGHTRLPSYAAGAVGTIMRCHGSHVLPDSNAHYLGEAPEPLYSVSFAAKDLWGAAENVEDEVVLDLWQSYLEIA